MRYTLFFPSSLFPFPFSHIRCSLLPAPCSLFPYPLLPAPCSLLPKNMYLT
ncbi:hypothetical protein [Moorena producens]|uniref:hypothetical protein n=1 Tax=Moorena producens TaxID=1155739 RepID=UPI001314C37D|nr:hypothetical protein [Moorena producens]